MPKRPKWNSADTKPPVGMQVLGWSLGPQGQNRFDVVEWVPPRGGPSTGQWLITGEFIACDITHWQALPDSPEPSSKVVSVDDTWARFVVQVKDPALGGLEWPACGLCGNTGIVDTRGTTKTLAGLSVGIRTNCICPNGQAPENQPTSRRTS